MAGKLAANELLADKLVEEKKDELLNKQYWDAFYKQNRGHLPSQFCISVLTDTPPDCVIVELGSGNGRDSHYFASQGRITAAMDISEQAIRSCESYAAEQDIRHSTFSQGDITNKDNLSAMINDARAKVKNRPITFYSRFVMHALNDAQEQAFLKHPSGLDANL